MKTPHSGLLAILTLALFVGALIVLTAIFGSADASASQVTPTVPTLSPGATGNASTTNISVAGSFNAGSTTLSSVFLGGVGIGTSSPFARFTLQANTSDQFYGILFAIASSSATASTTLFQINSNGDIITKGAVPTLGPCGTAAITATSTDRHGTVNVTGGTPTSCQITFSSPKTDTPTCVVSDSSAALAIGVSAASTTGFTTTMAATFSGSIYYICLQ